MNQSTLATTVSEEGSAFNFEAKAAILAALARSAVEAEEVVLELRAQLARAKEAARAEHSRELVFLRDRIAELGAELDKKGDQFFRSNVFVIDILDRVSLGPGATRINEGIHVSSGGQRQHALYGPYLSLGPGEYSLDFAIQVKRNFLKRPTFVVEAVWNIDTILAKHTTEVTSFASQNLFTRLKFCISSDQRQSKGGGLEFRLWADNISCANIPFIYLRKHN